MTAAAPPCVILADPQLAENIGSVARVMANFGLSDLRLVNPRDGWPQDRAWASARATALATCWERPATCHTAIPPA